MTDISLIGAGNLGTSLGYALSRKGYTIKTLSCRSISSAGESQRIIGEGNALTDNIQVAKEGEVVFICVPDEEISRVVEELASSNLSWSKKTIFHSSGLLSSELLSPLKAKGAAVGSFHPVQSFSRKKGDLRQFEGVYFGLEGDEEALKIGGKIVRHLGGHSLLIRREEKPLYHAACSFASNFFIVLLDIAISILTSTGLREEMAFETIMPLVQGTLQNVKEFNIPTSLTGPIPRGDAQSVQKHLEALRKFPDMYDLYVRLARRALTIAEKKNLREEKVRALKKLLEEK